MENCRGEAAAATNGAEEDDKESKVKFEEVRK